MRKNDDEDEVDLLLEGILDVVPDLPITQDKLNIFLTTLKSLVPEIEIASNIDEYKEEDNITKAKDFYKEKIDGENLCSPDPQGYQDAGRGARPSAQHCGSPAGRNRHLRSIREGRRNRRT